MSNGRPLRADTLLSERDALLKESSGRPLWSDATACQSNAASRLAIAMAKHAIAFLRQDDATAKRGRPNLRQGDATAKRGRPFLQQDDAMARRGRPLLRQDDAFLSLSRASFRLANAMAKQTGVLLTLRNEALSLNTPSLRCP